MPNRVGSVGSATERRRAVVAEQVTSEPDVRRVARRAPLLVEARLAPVDARIGVRAMLEQRLRELKRRDRADRLRRSLRCAADAGRAIGAWLAQPGDGVQRRSARIREVGIGAMLEQNRGELEIGVDHRHTQRARSVGRLFVHIRPMLQQQRGSADPRTPHGQEEGREPAG
jgi:hypothetical protein